MKHKPAIKINEAKRIARKADGTVLPVIDSKFTFLITPNAEDIKKGVRGDHSRCMYCQSCMRQHGCSLVYITRTRAYMELPDENGKLYLQRFMLSSPAKVKIKDFDTYDHVPPHAVVFLAPYGSHTLEAQNRTQRAWRRRVLAERLGPTPVPKKAYIVGQKVRGKGATVETFEDSLIRNVATGMFQFKTSQHMALA